MAIPERRLLVHAAAVLTLAAGFLTATTLRSDAATTTPIVAVNLVNDVSRRPVLGVSPLVDDTVVDLTALANRNLSLQAVLAPGTAAGSVRFTLTGATGSAYARTENVAPYFLCNDYVDCPLLAQADNYTLTVRAYSGADASGSALGGASTVRFRVSATAVAKPAVDVLFVGNSLIGTPTVSTGAAEPGVGGRPDVDRHQGDPLRQHAAADVGRR
jgi:hypothetical protein